MKNGKVCGFFGEILCAIARKKHGFCVGTRWTKKIDGFDYGFHFPFRVAVHKSRVMTLDLSNVCLRLCSARTKQLINNAEKERTRMPTEMYLITTFVCAFIM